MGSGVNGKRLSPLAIPYRARLPGRSRARHLAGGAAAKGRVVLATMMAAVLIYAGPWSSASAQSSPDPWAASGNQGRTWDEIKALPDWSGVWEPIMNRPPNGSQFSVQPPLTTRWQKKLEVIRKIAAAGGDVPSRAYHCIALGPPAEMGGPEALLEFLFTPGRVTIDSVQGWLRRIYVGQRVADDPDPSFQGSSVGHWEGDTLVIETVGLDPGNELLYGLPIGKGAHLIERLHLRGPNTLQLEVAVDGAESLVRTYRYTQVYHRIKYQLGQFDCAQNNRDVDPITGRQGFDIPPKF